MREGLALINRLGCNNVIAESDSTKIIEACNGEEAWWCESSAVLADCIDEASMVINVVFQHCPREANRIAHELARSCFSSMISCNWVDDPPSFILESLVNDVSNV
uniref:Uncharacterized protein n=1 Tax=Avena sativa TaxID=4498 RepID=A0ACD5XCW7_AVESA